MAQLRQLLFSLCIIAELIHRSRCQQWNGGRTNTSVAEKKNVVFFVIMLAFPDPNDPPAVADGPNLLPVIHLAVEHINGRPDILPDHSISLVVRSDGCNVVTTAGLSFLDILSNRRLENAIRAGMIGPSCSGSAVFLNSLTANEETAMVSVHIAGTTELQDEKRFPHAYGMASSSESYVEALVSLLKEGRCKRVAVLCEHADAFYRQIFDSLSRRLSQEGVSNIFSLELSLGTLQYSLLVLEKSSIFKPCPVYLLSSNELSRRIICAASERSNLVDYQWVHVEATVSDLTAQVNFTLDGKDYFCSQRSMQRALERSLLLFPVLEPSQKTEATIFGGSYNEYHRQYTERVQNSLTAGLQVTRWANLVYDGVWSLALALDRVLKSANDSFPIKPEHVSLLAKEIGQQLKAIHFKGVSGTIRFKGRYVARNLSVSRVLPDGKEEQVAIFDSASNILMTVAGASSGLLSCRPKGLSVLATVAAYILVGVAFSMVFSSHVATILLWTRKQVRASDPRLSQWIFLGCYLMCFGSLGYTSSKTFVVSDENHYRGWCYTINFTTFIGLTLVSGTLFARTWRFYRIFTHFRDPGCCVSNFSVHSLIVGTTAVTVFLLILWGAAFPYAPVSQGDGTMACFGKCYDTWGFIVLGYCWLLLLSSAALSLATTNISRSQKELYRTSRPAFLGYLSTLVILLTCPLVAVALVMHQLVVYFLLVSSTINAMVILCTAFTTLPPVMSACREEFKKRVRLGRKLWSM